MSPSAYAWYAGLQNLSISNRDPAGCSSAAPHTILSRMKCSEWAGGSRSLSHADGQLWAALLKTFRCDDACLRRLFSSFDACCSPDPYNFGPL